MRRYATVLKKLKMSCWMFAVIVRQGSSVLLYENVDILCREYLRFRYEKETSFAFFDAIKYCVTIFPVTFLNDAITINIFLYVLDSIQCGWIFPEIQLKQPWTEHLINIILYVLVWKITFFFVWKIEELFFAYFYFKMWQLRSCLREVTLM